MSDPVISYADPRDVLAKALAGYLPPETMRLPVWAAENRWLANEGGGYVGRWDNSYAPYLVGPMEALDGEYTTVAVVGPGQCGKTEVANNWMMRSIDLDPAPMLRYMQTDAAIRAYVRSTIDPMIEAHEAILAKRGLRAVDDSLNHKRFRGMSVEFLAATGSNMISKSAARIVADEIDSYAESLGNVKDLLDVRRQTFGSESTLLTISHPDAVLGLDPAGWKRGIMAIYAASTRHSWWWPCPHCNAFISPNPGSIRECKLVYPDDAPLETVEAEARLLCPCCGSLIEDHHRRDMNRRAYENHGGWIGAGQVIEEDGTVSGTLSPSATAGYWIVGVMSPFLWGGIGGLARSIAAAERERIATGSMDTIKEVWSKKAGIPYSPPRAVSAMEAATLADRAERDLILGVVPEGVRFITGMADIQGRHFEYLFRGWGENGESWIIEHGVIPADVAVSPSDWDALIRRLASASFPLADGSGRHMRVMASGFDSGGIEGVTLQAYEAWRRARRSGLARRLGVIDGREAWNLLPLKGGSSLNGPRLLTVRPESAQRNRAGALDQVMLGITNPNLFKDDLAVHLAVPAPGPWYVHIPAGLLGDYPQGQNRLDPPHLFLEQMLSERRTKSGRWEKIVSSARNEGLDLMVGTHAMAFLIGLPRILWDSPPAWAAPWDKNSLVFTPRPDEGAPADTATGRPVPSGPSAPVMPSAPAPRPALRRMARSSYLTGLGR
ncbi:terminase gpA endonuclease subunit [Granulibacter bethesdensis]|nr:terminase gpA endonuclease subunit [Granulibacter bethesdensis]